VISNRSGIRVRMVVAASDQFIILLVSAPICVI